MGLRREKSILAFARESHQAALDIVLGPSDDYELLFTCPAGNADEAVHRLMKEANIEAARIGEIVGAPEEIILIETSGSMRRLAIKGWDHFAGNEE